MSLSPSSVIPGFRYRDARGAIEWLCNVFGFERNAVYEGENGTIAHAQLTLNGGMVMLGTGRDDEYSRSFKTPEELGGFETASAYMVVADADAAFARAAAAGATVVKELYDT
ncbi:MAG: VOC family protein, partial [Tepidisphaeraceae bacterium]